MDSCAVPSIPGTITGPTTVNIEGMDYIQYSINPVDIANNYDTLF